MDKYIRPEIETMQLELEGPLYAGTKIYTGGAEEKNPPEIQSLEGEDAMPAVFSCPTEGED